jgi:hypothetical protein
VYYPRTLYFDSEEFRGVTDKAQKMFSKDPQGLIPEGQLSKWFGSFDKEQLKGNRGTYEIKTAEINHRRYFHLSTGYSTQNLATHFNRIFVFGGGATTAGDLQLQYVYAQYKKALVAPLLDHLDHRFPLNKIVLYDDIHPREKLELFENVKFKSGDNIPDFAMALKLQKYVDWKF